MDKQHIQELIDNIDVEDFENSEVGDIYEIGDTLFKVTTVKPINLHKSKFSIDISTEDGYTWSLFPVKIYNYRPPTPTDFSYNKRRKSKNRERDLEIYQKSKTMKSKDIAEEYGISYAMVRYIIRKMKKDEVG